MGASQCCSYYLVCWYLNKFFDKITYSADQNPFAVPNAIKLCPRINSSIE